MFRKILAVVVLVLASACVMQAQEVIMNQPSADVVAKGKLFVRSDSFYTQDPAFYEQNINTAYGLFKNFEVSLNGVNISHTTSQAVIVPGFTWAIINNDNFTLYVGDQYWKPVANSIIYHNGNVSYEAAALKFFKGRLRLTGGSFQSHNAYQLGNRAGAIGGVEYSLHTFKNGWSLGPGLDYASGRGINGYTSPGLNIMKGNFFICPGYMIGNPHNLNGAHQSFVMIGYTF